MLVDFFNEGPAIRAIDRLNNITDPINRMTPLRSPQKGGPEPDAEDKKGGSKTRNGGAAKLDELLREIRDEGKVPRWSDWINAGGEWNGHKF